MHDWQFMFYFLCKHHLFDTQIADLFLCWGVVSQSFNPKTDSLRPHVNSIFIKTL